MKCENNGRDYLQFKDVKSLKFKPILEVKIGDRVYYKRYLEITFLSDNKIYVPFKTIMKDCLELKMD